MAVTQKPVKYQSSDGQEFDNEPDAERHDKIATACKNYDLAREAYGKVLAESQRTADGYPFTFGGSRDYYCIVGLHRPMLKQVSFYGWNKLFDLEGDRFLIHQEGEYPHERNVAYRIGELYREKRNAEKALLARLRESLADFESEIAAFAKKIEG